ncbi:CCR4-NOT transcription complex subunit 7 [Phytophthora nicotianae]|uniref:CCR4-NOT transcription complex subunit 7 n=1 Tax=Phytophthora nicotianae TaxID=4792 RepID=A0A0W8DBX0_PHYNI|nr:CCR4-NOT transcription complex subunit 7 [Phytophthora nicotianae]
MDADGDDTEYALCPPVAHRRDTITRQLQREILGEMAADRVQEEPSDASQEHEQKSEEDEPPSTPSKRRTLSPGKAMQLLPDVEALDAAISRRDTVSPEALKAVMKAAGGLEKVAAQKKSSPVKTRDILEASELLQVEKELLGSSPDRRRDTEEILDSPARSTRSKTASASHSNAAGKQSQSFTGLPRDEDTAEFSLGHLLAESSVYELTKSAPDSDLHDLPGSLGDLANEVAGQSNHTQQSNDQDATMEANDTMTSSRNQSNMSLVSDESDDEYAAKRASLQVNLKSQFDRVSEPSQSPRRPLTPESRPVQLITMEELLSSVVLNEESTLVEAAGAFFGDEAESSDSQVSKDVKLACAHDTCSAVIERHVQDVSSWSAAVTEELSTSLHVKAPAVFSPENLDDAGREAIQALYATETLVARTGWCQLQTQMEKQLTSSLSIGANALSTDVKSLKDSVAADALKRQDELAAIKVMIDREEQMALLLDAIEEQQGAHDEYVKAVKGLEKECSSLSLEESVLQSRLKVLEGRAAELEPVTSEAATRFGQEVLATEEMLAIQESLSVWKIREATASILRLSARLEDVLFDVEICVDVHLGSLSASEASTSIKTNELLKRRAGNTYLPYEGDVVLVLQRLLLDPHYLSRIADESELGDGIDGRICSKLQVLENFISRSFRLLKELRELSTHFSMRYDEEDSTLWVDFLNFPSVASRIDVEGAQFCVGFSLLPVFPYTDYQTTVQVPYGQVCFMMRSRYLVVILMVSWFAL